MTSDPPDQLRSPDRITPAIRRWVETESARWSADGLLTQDQARSILERYESHEALSTRRSRRLFFVLTGMAILMAAVGVLLLIGHNWEAIPRSAKVTLIFSAVAASFAASAVSYARGKPVHGELLAFAGTLLYGNAIWLLAQAFHIRSHYPNGVLWWMIGALITAHALRSVITGAEAVILLSVWVGMESVAFQSPAYGFWIGILLVLGLALRLGSAILAVLAGVSVPLWLLFASFNAWMTSGQAFILSLLAGCAIFSTSGFWPRPAVADAWGKTGLAVILCSMIPLTFSDYHSGGHPGWEPRLAASVAAGLILLALAAAGWVHRRRRGERIDVPIAIVAAAGTLALLVAVAAGSARELEVASFLAILFSATSVLVAVWEIQRGISLDQGRSFFTGVLYLLLFVLIRWVDLIGDMVSSAGIFFVAAIVLWATGRYWQGRRRVRPLPGEAAGG